MNIRHLMNIIQLFKYEALYLHLLYSIIFWLFIGAIEFLLINFPLGLLELVMFGLVKLANNYKN